MPLNPMGFGGGGNHILHRGDFAISYQPDSTATMSVFHGDDCSDETAICDYRDKDRARFFILNGDWREEYCAALRDGGGIEACLEIYRANKDKHGSSWSTDDKAIESAKSEAR